MITTQKLKGIVFDFNGTLFFDSDFHERAWMLSAERITGHAVSLEDYYHHMHGRNNFAILSYLMGRDPSAQECEQLGEEKEELYRKLCMQETNGKLSLAPGAPALLDFLKQNGLACAIATSAGWGNLKFYIEVFDLYRWFSPEHIIYDDGSGIISKPDPDLYLRACRALQIPAQQLAMAEDSFSGLLGITRANAGYRIGISPDGEAGITGKEYTDVIISTNDQIDRSLFERNE